MEDQVPSSKEFVTPGEVPQDGNYYTDPQGPRFNNPAEFDRRMQPQQPTVNQPMPPMPDFQAMKDLAFKQAVAQVQAAQPPQQPQPQPQAQPKVVYVRRNLTLAEIILVFALSIGGVLGIQGIWTLATDVLPRLEIREK